MIRTKIKSKGFTLIELIVVISIFMIITSVVLFNESQFSSDIVVTNLAYEVALAIRQAQSYGVAVKASSLYGGFGFNSGYGVHFGTDGAHPDPIKYNPLTSFTFFADTYTPDSNINPDGNDHVYEGDTSGNSEYRDTYRLPAGNTVRNIVYCTTGSQSNGNILTNMTPGSPGAGTGYLDITYQRPKPDANITIITGANGSQVYSGLSKVYLEVYAALGDKFKVVTVYSNGQISVPTTNDIVCP